MKTFHLVAVMACFLGYTTFALVTTGCSSNTPIYEGEYYGGMPVDTAVVEPTSGGGYRTVSGDPLVAMNNGIEETSMLPYGGGDQGIRTVEDETPFYSTN